MCRLPDLVPGKVAINSSLHDSEKDSEVNTVGIIIFSGKDPRSAVACNTDYNSLCRQLPSSENVIPTLDTHV